MNPRIKNILAVSAIVLILTIAGSAISYVRTYDRQVEPTSFRSFSVTGEGKVVSVPDVAQFTFTVITEGGTDIAKLQSENVEKMNKAIQYVKDNGVDVKDVKTLNYDLQPRYETSTCTPDGRCEPPSIAGYTVQQSVEVKVRNVAKAGELLSGVVNAGANNVSQLSFTIDDPTQLENKARAEAIAEAKVKAKAMAAAGGFKVGKILSISEGAYNTPMPMYASREMNVMSADAGMKSVMAEPGSTDTVINVTVVYEIR